MIDPRPQIAATARRVGRDRRARSAAATALEVLGILVALAGVALFSVPAALILGGIALVFLAQGVAAS